MYKKRDYVKSSEISQFSFCSLAWYWGKIGIELESKEANIGTEKHIELGKNIDLYKKTHKVSIIFLVIFIISLVLLIWLILYLY